MAVDDVKIYGEVRRELASFGLDGATKQLRSSAYGELGTVAYGKSGIYNIADEGQYFVATNPTPGTGISGIAAADGINNAEGLLLLTNDNTDGKRVYLDYLYLRNTAAGTNGTNMDFTVKIDSAARYTSGGSAITPVNVNMDDSSTCGCTMYFGALVTTTSTTCRLISHHVLRRATIIVAGDEFFVNFGAPPSPSVRTGTLAADSTTNVSYSYNAPPVILGSGDCVWMAANAASQSAAADWEFEMGFWVR